MSDNQDAARRHAAEQARQGRPAPVYSPSTSSVIRDAGKAAYDAQMRAQAEKRQAEQQKRK